MQKNYFIEVKPIFDKKIRLMCQFPYPGHKKGCPNFNKRSDCPPKSSLIHKIINLDKKVYAIYNIFDLAAHVNRMKKKHSNWSQRQLYCCLYWQPKARKALKEKISLFLRQFPDLYIVKNPEAQGVNVTQTMFDAGVILEWPPRKMAYQIVLAGNYIGPKLG